MKPLTIYLRLRDRFRAYLTQRYRKRMRKLLTVHEPKNIAFPKLHDSRVSQEWHRNGFK